MKLLDVLTLFHNWMADKDFIWWPFSFLRPEPQVSIDTKLVMLMSACFGGLAFTMFTVFAVMNNMFTLNSAFMTLVSSFLGFFLWFQFITRPLWNRRARQLQSTK